MHKNIELKAIGSRKDCWHAIESPLQEIRDLRKSGVNWTSPLMNRRFQLIYPEVLKSAKTILRRLNPIDFTSYAEDVSQEWANAMILAGFESCAYDLIGPYAYSILKRICLKIVITSHKHKERVITDSDEHAESSAPLMVRLIEEQRRGVRRIVLLLPKKDRQVAIGHYWCRWDDDRLSEKLGTSVAAIKTRLSRVRETLAARLSCYDPWSRSE